MRCRMCEKEKERTDFGICKECLEEIDKKEEAKHDTYQG